VKFAVENGLSVHVRHRRHDSNGSRYREAAVLYRYSKRRKRRSPLRHRGHATPNGSFNLVKFVIDDVVKPSGEKIRVDWHGHNDRGLSIANSLAAIAAGAHQVHAAANALGERVGNTPMELMLVNLRLMGLIQQDLSRLKEYCEKVAKATHTMIPPNYPVVGHDAFRTATGVHAAALIKAFRKNDLALANAVLQRCARAPLRPRPGYRDRPDERQVQRAVLAREAPHSGRRRRCHAHL